MSFVIIYKLIGDDIIFELNNVFNNFNLEIKQGSFISIIGPIASGKTSLLEEIYKRFSDDYIVSIIKDEEEFTKETVEEELIYRLEKYNVSKNEIKSRIKRVLNGLSIYELLHKEIKTLTVIDKERLSLALGLVINPEILLLDNPFPCFNRTEEEKIYKLLRNLSNKGMTIIITTTNAEECLITDKVLIINNFQKIAYDKPTRILNDESLLKKNGMDMPFMMDLSSKLKTYGLISKNINDPERMVDVLWN